MRLPTLLPVAVLLLAAPALAQNANTLTCSPRQGHDNYRTQHTLTVDPSNPETVWVGVEYGGIFKSVDGGTTWARADGGITAYADAASGQRCIQEMGRLVVDPADGNRVLMSRVESPGTITMLFSENAGVWETRDGGAAWAQLIKPGMNASGSSALALAPGGAILHGVNNNHASWGGAPPDLYNTTGILYRSADAGGTWQELPTGAPHGLRSTAVFADPTDAQHIWFVVFLARNGEPIAQAEQWTYLESRDGGTTWERGSEKFPAGFRAPADAAVSSRTFAHRLISFMALEGPQASYVTLDDGRTWTRTSHHMFTARYDPHDATGRHLLGYAPYENPPGLFDSRDGGLTWTRLGNTPSEVDHQSNFGVRISEIAWHPTRPDTVYASASGGYIWKSTDGGRTWLTIFTLEQMRATTDVVQAPAAAAPEPVPAPAPGPTTDPTTDPAPAPAPAPTPDSARPVFSVPFVPAEQAVAFYIFGATLPSGVQNPTFEIETADPSTPVSAASAGTVVNIRATSQGDFSVFVIPSGTSPWVIGYDHVNNVTVSVGQTVEAGTVLGTMGRLGNGRGRTELQINLTGQTPELAYCPTQFGTEAFNAAFAAAAQRVNGSATVCTGETVVP